MNGYTSQPILNRWLSIAACGMLAWFLAKILWSLAIVPFYKTVGRRTIKRINDYIDWTENLK